MHPHAVSGFSEMTCYRKLATILEIFLRDTILTVDDGKRTRKATKLARTKNAEINGEKIGSSTTMGRRIDLLLGAQGIQLSFSEWKRQNVTAKQSLKQQCKNVRTNVEILKSILDLVESHVSSRYGDSNGIYIIGTDWIGLQGCMFFAKQVGDFYVVKGVDTLSIPRFIEHLADIRQTFQLIAHWKKHCLKLQRIVVPAQMKKEAKDRLTMLTGRKRDTTPDPKKPSHTHTFTTPTKRRKHM